MSLKNPTWCLILVAIIATAMIVINELGYGAISLFLLFPAVWLMIKATEDFPNHL